jgi:hypothetical protein
MTIWTYEKAVFQSKLAASTKLVLLALNSHVNRLGQSCFPSYKRLEAFTSLKRSTIIEHIGIAESQGWLKRVNRFGDNGKQRSNLFHLQVPHHIMMASDASEIDEEEEEIGGPESGRWGSSNWTEGVQQVDPEVTKGTNHSKRTKKTASELPKNFAVTDDLRRWATEKGYASPDSLLESFKLYHTAKGSTYKDWTAAFQMWIKKDKEFSSSKSKTSGVSSTKTKSLADMDYSESFF